MKGVIKTRTMSTTYKRAHTVTHTQRNYKRPFSPANFTQLTTTKLGRPAGTAPIGLGVTAAAGLPTSLRYNLHPEAIRARDFTTAAKGFNNNTFPVHRQIYKGANLYWYYSNSAFFERCLCIGEIHTHTHTHAHTCTAATMLRAMSRRRVSHSSGAGSVSRIATLGDCCPTDSHARPSTREWSTMDS
jgi:hypothetical protein